MDAIKTFFKNLDLLDSATLVSQSIQFVIWAVVILLLAWLARKAINRAVTDNAMRYRAKKITRFTSYALIILLAIITFTGKVQYFGLTLGLLSAGLAFALQEVILSIAGWISLYFSGIYKTGDRIEINGIKGDVIDIGVFRTTLMEIGEWVSSDNYSGRIVQISNAFIFKGAVRNYSSDFPFVWDEINIPIRYGSDLILAQRIIEERAQKILAAYAQYAKEHWNTMVQKYLIENANIEPTLKLKLTDNWVDFNLRYVVDYKSRRHTADLLYRDIKSAIDATNGAVQLASATFEVTSIPPVNFTKT